MKIFITILFLSFLSGLNCIPLKHVDIDEWGRPDKLGRRHRVENDQNPNSMKHLVEVKKILSSSNQFDFEMYKKLLTFTNHADHNLEFPTLLLSQIDNLMKSLQHDFPEYIKVSSIGQSW